MFTLLPVEEIDTIVREHERQPEHRFAQRILAEEVTLMIHQSESQPTFCFHSLTDMFCRGGLRGRAGSHERPFRNRLLRFTRTRYYKVSGQRSTVGVLYRGPVVRRNAPYSCCQLWSYLVKVFVCFSFSSTTFDAFPATARQLALGKGLYLNNVPKPDVHFKLDRNHLVDGRVVILRAGKDKHLILALR